MLALARTMQPGLHRRPDLHRLIHSNTSTTATNSRSRIRKPTIFAIRRLIDTPPLQPLRPNPHSARATAIRSPSRFRPLEAFGRRPPEYVAPRQRPASETLHINGRQTMSASAAAFFESSRRGRGRPAGLILDVGAGRHPRRGGGRRLARERRCQRPSNGALWWWPAARPRVRRMRAISWPIRGLDRAAAATSALAQTAIPDGSAISTSHGAAAINPYDLVFHMRPTTESSRRRTSRPYGTAFCDRL